MHQLPPLCSLGRVLRAWLGALPPPPTLQPHFPPPCGLNTYNTKPYCTGPAPASHMMAWILQVGLRPDSSLRLPGPRPPPRPRRAWATRMSHVPDPQARDQALQVLHLQPWHTWSRFPPLPIGTEGVVTATLLRGSAGRAVDCPAFSESADTLFGARSF
jgi:hypothetical protein